MYDFFSDTKTKPTAQMRQAVLACEVGDEQKGEDPTTIQLCARVADLLGKEAAVFLPSGTMCNEIAVNVHTNPGDEIICDRSSHIINFEAGGAAAISGVMISAINGEDGIFCAEQLAPMIRPSSRYAPTSSLVCVEQTANMGGGTVWPVKTLDEVSALAHEAGLRTHMDGARLMNAVVKSGESAAHHTKGYDSVWIDFTKGLGAPVGAVLAGSEAFIESAWQIKQRLGGAMRQSGIVASMCLYDHALAAELGEQIGAMTMIERVLPVQTNLIFFDLAPEAMNASQLVAALAGDGIQIGAFGARRIRVVTHLDVTPSSGAHLIERLAHHLQSNG